MTPVHLTVVCGTTEEALVFEPVALQFRESPGPDVFAKKNNRTLGETLAHPRYRNLMPAVQARYSAALPQKLGTFLAELKGRGDPFYRQFLNSYGDLPFCTFRLAAPCYRQLKGLYAYADGEPLVYLGRCLDSFGKRIDSGYGTIHPKNCYRDGQSTNCHLNALIATHRESVSLHVCCLSNDAAIVRLEQLLLRQYQPAWNIQLKGGSP